MWRIQRVRRREDARPHDDGLPARGVCAHRGGALARPENTLAAFRHAGEVGVHQVEFDVRRTADGEIVVIHDATVDRTTDGRGRVRDWKLADLRRLDAGLPGLDARQRGFAGERVPILEEVLSVLPQDVWINVQIKRGEPVARDVARTVLDAGRLHQVILSCGNQDARTAKAVHPRLRVCTLARQRTRASYVEHAILTGAHFIQFHHLRGPMEPQLAEQAHGAGIRVNFFCAPSATTAELIALFEAGVDFVLVDDLERGLEAARRVGIEPLARACVTAPSQATIQPASGPV